MSGQPEEMRITVNSSDHAMQLTYTAHRSVRGEQRRDHRKGSRASTYFCLVGGAVGHYKTRNLYFLVDMLPSERMCMLPIRAPLR